MSNKIKGKYGEDTAVNYLIKNKYKIIARNYHFSRYGEVDIIAQDKDTLCFVEVKTRTSDKFGTPLEAVTKTKLDKIRKCASAFISNSELKIKKYRIDAISILLSSKTDTDEPEITHIKNIEF